MQLLEVIFIFPLTFMEFWGHVSSHFPHTTQDSASNFTLFRTFGISIPGVWVLTGSFCLRNSRASKGQLTAHQLQFLHFSSSILSSVLPVSGIWLSSSAPWKFSQISTQSPQPVHLSG